MDTTKDISLKFLHFEVRGMTLIKDWYENIGSVEMKPTIIHSIDEAKNVMNDNGFGAQEILGAKLHIFAVYGLPEPYLYPGYTPFKLDVEQMYIGELSDKEKNFLDSSDTIMPFTKFIK